MRPTAIGGGGGAASSRRAALIAGAALALAPRPAAARVETARLLPGGGGLAGFAAAPPPGRRGGPPPRPPPDEGGIGAQARQALALLADGDAAAAQGEWEAALAAYDRAARFDGLALSLKARAASGRMLFQLGRLDDALLAYEDVEAGGGGSGEVHAALAVARYSLHRGGAEDEWAAATSLEPRWEEDVSFVRRVWPPAMVAAVERFLELK